MTPNRLYHVLGHEMVHAEHYATGQWDEWEDKYKEEGANRLSEIAAHIWNLTQHWVIPCPEVYASSQKWLNDYYNESWLGRVPRQVQDSVYSQYSQWRWLVNGLLPK